MKLALDLAFVVLSASLVTIAALALTSVFALVTHSSVLAAWQWPDGHPLLAEQPRDVAASAILAFNVGGLWLIVGLLRRIFATLVAGAPFILENARRLRFIGLVLAAQELAHYALWGLFIITHNAAAHFIRHELDITGLFGIGLMFALAEVFEEGVRMKKDLDLTI